MDGWQYHDIGFENQTKKVNGINIWKYHWQKLGVPPIEVPHPQYSEQLHELTLYKIQTKQGQITFAAGEVSNNVWCIYVSEKESPNKLINKDIKS